VPLTTVAPAAVLRAESEASKSALRGQDQIHITRFPFNVGRESRSRGYDALKRDFDRRLGNAKSINDLYLIDAGDSLHISREHFRVDWINGRLIIVDRGSHSGTIVAGKRIGIGQPTDDVEVLDGDTIVVGHSNSPYVFRFQIENGARP